MAANVLKVRLNDCRLTIADLRLQIADGAEFGGFSAKFKQSIEPRVLNRISLSRN